QLVADDVDASGSLRQDTPIAVAEEHVAGAVPERIVVSPAVVHKAEHGETLAINGVAVQHGPVIAVGVSKSVICLIDSLVRHISLAFGPHDFPQRLRGVVLLVVDSALCLPANARKRDRSGSATPAACS